MKHPLHVAINLLERAQTNKAHPRIIAKLESRVNLIAKETAERLSQLPFMKDGLTVDISYFDNIPGTKKGSK